jgi:transposase
MVSHDDEHGAEHGAQHVEVGFGSRRRVEVISGVERRRRWSGEEKARITAESFVAGVNVSDVARRHAMSLGLLHHWRRLARQAGSSAEAAFVPVLPLEDTSDAGSSGSGAMIEIALGGACIRVRGRVDGAALRTVIAAVRSA